MRILSSTALLLSAIIPQALTLATTTITLHMPASQLLPNPNALPPSTHATLTQLYTTYTAPLTTANSFVFHNVSAGSYLADVHCATHGFAPLRVDVMADKADTDTLQVRAWETFRGNDWDNKGEEIRAAGAAGLPVRVLGGKVYFLERGSFSVLSILKNPMILLGLVSMAIFIGMPKLVENMDPEMRAEWEENQKNNPMNSIMGGGQPGSNFDMAAFLAGSNKKDEGGESNSGAKKGTRK